MLTSDDGTCALYNAFCFGQSCGIPAFAFAIVRHIPGLSDQVPRSRSTILCQTAAGGPVPGLILLIPRFGRRAHDRVPKSKVLSAQTSLSIEIAYNLELEYVCIYQV